VNLFEFKISLKVDPNSDLPPEMLGTLEKILGISKKLTLIYTGSNNNFSSKKFHNAIDRRMKFLVLIRTKSNCIFGFYTSKTFNPSYSSKKYIKDEQAFIFSCQINGNKLKDPIKLPIDIINAESAIFSDLNIFFALGEGYDLYIPNECNMNESIANFPKTYLYQGDAEKATNFFTGGVAKFLIEEIQLFQVENTY
jgi:hypothetical protein